MSKESLETLIEIGNEIKRGEISLGSMEQRFCEKFGMTPIPAKREGAYELSFYRISRWAADLCEQWVNNDYRDFMFYRSDLFPSAFEGISVKEMVPEYKEELEGHPKCLYYSFLELSVGTNRLKVLLGQDNCLFYGTEWSEVMWQVV